MSSDPQLPDISDSGLPDSTGLRMLAVHAHPDDEASKGAALMAAYVHAGARVMVATATDGAMGDLNNPHYGEAIRVQRDIAAVRYQEMADAAKILGIEHRWLGFRDSGFPEGNDPMANLEPGCFADIPVEDATAPLMRLIREFKPHVLLTYDEIGGYPHPDHLRTHAISIEAYEKSGDPEAYPGTGEPWEISKLYYDRAFNPDKFRAVHRALIASGQESPYADRIAWYDRVEAGEDDPDAGVSPNIRSPLKSMQANSWNTETPPYALIAPRSTPTAHSSLRQMKSCASSGHGKTMCSSTPKFPPACPKTIYSPGSETPR